MPTLKRLSLASRSTSLLSTATNVRMSRLTRWCYDCCAPADISLPTTHCGTGSVTDPAYDHDHQTQGIRQFNDHVAADNRVEQVIVPLRDGLTLIRKKD